MTPLMIGLHGKMGAGKDAALERLQCLSVDTFVKASFAAKLKESVSALLGLTLEQIEEMKRSDATSIEVITHHDGGMASVQTRMNMRTLLQRYGTESHRDVFGDNFWVDQAMAPFRYAVDQTLIPVFTDCRFENEAKAIKAAGGIIAHIVGEDLDTGDHASEAVLPDSLIDFVIDNSVRDDGFAHLDDQIALLIDHVRSLVAKSTTSAPAARKVTLEGWPDRG